MKPGGIKWDCPGRGSHPVLPTNELGSKKRLGHLIHRLKKNDLYKEYNAIIEEQLQQGIIKATSEVPTGNEFYIPHKALVKEEAESMKVRIVSQ